ncbi:MAG: OB-fold domain-containing protein, partial [Chloroflexi bacterium]|nr:OB-fold domain-containing protein [Chloroflexota bacterium]
SYQRYLAFRNIVPVDVGIRGEEIPFTEISLLWRSRKAVLSLCGSRCKRCGTPQYPPQRICVNPDCGAVDEMAEYCFAGKKAALATYTADYLAAGVESPALYGTLDFEGGGTFPFDITDCSLEDLKVGMRMEMTFRKKYVDEARGHHGYHWKATPDRA